MKRLEHAFGTETEEETYERAMEKQAHNFEVMVCGGTNREQALTKTEVAALQARGTYGLAWIVACSFEQERQP
ncbi:MAG: hypothetical protein JST54_28980 [Deltaproteobacteria bacterium]|nr:hypothetical protein [Deltaproteobacteria bacterium]